MKNFFQKISKLDINLLAIGAAAVLVLLLLPLLAVGSYAHPCADDYSYSAGVRQAWLSTHSLPAALEAAVQMVKSTYYSWQGTFSSVFLMALCPAVWGQEWYVLTPVLMLGSIVFSHFFALYVLMVKCLRLNRWTWCFVSSILSVWILQTVHSPVNGIYWYNGAVHYTFMHGVMLCTLALMGCFYLETGKGKKVVWAVLSLLGCVICGGANYATALLGIVCVVGLAILASLLQKKVSVGGIIFTLCYGISFWFNISAGGNGVRQNSFEGKGPIDAIWSSFDVSFEFMAQWMNLQTLMVLLLLIPMLWNGAGKLRIKCRFPAAFTAMSVCLIACMFTPLFYAMGGAGVDRHTNIVKMWFQLLLVCNLFYWMGWLRGKKAKPDVPHYTLYYIVTVMLLAGHFILTDTVLKDYSSYAAYISLSAGEAKAYYEDFRERLEVIDGAENSEVVEVKSYSVEPYLLYFDDITEDAEDWRNSAMANWYQKAGIYVSD